MGTHAQAATADAARDALHRHRQSVYEKAHGCWAWLLRQSGVEDQFLRVRKPGPCPFCGAGTDRYTFTDRNGDGDFVCRGCPANGAAQAFGGKGITFLMKYHGWSWSVACDWVLERLADPNLPKLKEKIKDIRSNARGKGMTPEKIEWRRSKMRSLWAEAKPVERGDPVDLWLRSRVPGLEKIPRVIRFHPALEYVQEVEVNGETRYVSRGKHPGMLCAVTDNEGRCCNLHRTYLTVDGRKAVITDEDGVILTDHKGEPLAVRKQMPAVPCVSPAIRLVEGQHRHLGIGEGVETALACQVFARTPSYSTISTSGMRGFIVPDWVEMLTIFADNDLPDSNGRRPGFDAAHALHQRDDIVDRIKQRTLKVFVRTPQKVGTDIRDLLVSLAERKAVV